MGSTIRDVARVAGVSAKSASAVLKGNGQSVALKPEKVERIRQAARELRYRVDDPGLDDPRLDQLAVDHLGTKGRAPCFHVPRSGLIAVVLQRFGRLGNEHPYHSQVLNGVVEALFPKDYTLSLCPRMISAGHPDLTGKGRFDGLLWCRPDFNLVSQEVLEGATIPVVMMHVPPGIVNGVPTFCADNLGAMRQVVEHLVGLGHRKLAFAIDPWSEMSVEGQSRANAFREASKLAGLVAPDVLVLERDPKVLARYAKASPPHTALVCFSDELAGFVLSSCERLGISVPRDLSVVGFDSSSFCETTRPRLTSINQPVERIAKSATNHLLTLIQEAKDGLPQSAITACVYVCGFDIRDSTAPPRST